ncbi:MAG: orotidine-5'-phosphate decarboxylase [Brevinematia bacterium]
MPKTDKIIVAIDAISLDEFVEVFEKTKNTFLWYKIHSIFLLEHKKVIEVLRENSKKVFLDLKFFDIPATVEKHIKVISKFCDMFTIHLLSGKECIKTASQVSKDLGIIPVGVSILTSLCEEDLKLIGIEKSINDEVLKLVELGLNEGIKHFVCSPLEVELIKSKFPEVKLITPGIRITKSHDDQKRTTSPKEALSKGADYLVIGRDITRLEKVEEIENYI